MFHVRVRRRTSSSAAADCKPRIRVNLCHCTHPSRTCTPVSRVTMGRCSPLLTAVVVAAVMCVDAVRSAVSQPMDAVVSAAATKPQLTAAVVVISLLAYAWMQYRAVSCDFLAPIPP